MDILLFLLTVYCSFALFYGPYRLFIDATKYVRKDSLLFKMQAVAKKIRYVPLALFLAVILVTLLINVSPEVIQDLLGYVFALLALPLVSFPFVMCAFVLFSMTDRTARSQIKDFWKNPFVFERYGLFGVMFGVIKALPLVFISLLTLFLRVFSSVPVVSDDDVPKNPYAYDATHYDRTGILIHPSNTFNTESSKDWS